jgi:hypothetical protein
MATGLQPFPRTSDSVDRVAQLMMSAWGTAVSRSFTDSQSKRSRKRSASAAALSGLRPQIRTLRIGRTVACASISMGASLPVPTTNSDEASCRASSRAARAEAAAVRRLVSALPSMQARGVPCWPSHRIYKPEMAGRPALAFCGNTLTIFIPIYPACSQAGISSMVASPSGRCMA